MSEMGVRPWETDLLTVGEFYAFCATAQARRDQS